MTRPLWKNPLAILLALSLAVNAFIGAKLLGHRLGPAIWGSSETHRHPRHAMRAFLRDSDDALRDRFRALRREAKARRAERRAELAPLWSVANAAIAADPFDAEKLAAAMAAVREKRVERHADRDARLIAFIGALPLDDRRRLAAEFEKVDFSRQRRRR